jgi:hypothetical protein
MNARVSKAFLTAAQTARTFATIDELQNLGDDGSIQLPSEDVNFDTQAAFQFVR